MKKIFLLIVLVVLNNCISDTSFSVPEISCEDSALQVTHTIAQVKEMAGYGIVSFTTDIVIEGYVVSNDESGNIYKTLSVQDDIKNPTAAIRFSIDVPNLYSVFPTGRKIFVKLNGLSIGYNRGSLEIGVVNGSDLVRIPNAIVFEHFQRSCETLKIEPKVVAISELDDSMIDMLVEISDVQFKTEDLENTFGEINSTKTVERILTQVGDDCISESNLILTISGFSDFKNLELPSGKGTINGILTKYYSEYQLVVRDELDLNFDKDRCAEVKSLEATISYAEIIEMYKEQVVEFGIDTNFIFEGYVISSDQQGNFINRLVVQDKTENPTGGFQLLIDEENLFERYQVGDRVLLKLNRLYLDKIDGVFTVGYYKNETVTEIEEGVIENFLMNTNENFSIMPLDVSISDLNLITNSAILMKLSNIQLRQDELGKAFTYYSGDNDGFRILKVCDDFQELQLETLGSASFSNDKFPVKNGNIEGVVFKNENQVKMQIRSLEDLVFEDSYEICEVVIPKILITEVADPSNSVGSRFIELYNATNKIVSLNGWVLHKYLNGSTNISGNGIELSGLILEPNGFVILANTDFQSIFIMLPDIESTYISGNGDDVYELVDNHGAVHDVFGVIGEDGTGTLWDYVDGKAIRNIEITEPNSDFTISEWAVFTKSNDFEQIAPQNYNPKYR